MQQLVARLSAIDAEAGAALKVISYFDRLNEGRAGIESLVRGAAVLSGHAAGLRDQERHLYFRVLPDGSVEQASAGRAVGPWAEALDPAWPAVPVLDTGPGVAWLETTRPRDLDGVILERLAVSVRAVLDRTHRRAVRDDAAALEVLLTEAATADERLEAARRLGWSPTARVRVLAAFPNETHRPAVEISGTCAFLVGADEKPDRNAPPAARLGVGERVPILQAPTSWKQARTALRLTGRQTPDDPGPSTLSYTNLGALAALVESFPPSAPLPTDVVRLQQACASTPWLMETLHNIAVHPSLRAASTGAHVHHSTLQVRAEQAEQLLGWPLLTVGGRLRLQSALVVRKLAETT